MFPGQLLDERYRLEAESGSGGMGTVWRALDTRIERTVAIKILHSHLARDEQLRMRFAREARAVGGLQHPAVVQLHDFTETTVDGAPVAYLVMEFVHGSSLSHVLTQQGSLTAAQTLTLIAAAADALQAAHDRGIVHRDIKPGNILVGDKVVKIVDFGISQSYGDIKLTSTGHFMGSLHYVSPEQLQGGTLGPGSDVYALGVVAYEALTGDRPFNGDTPASILAGHLQHPPKPLPSDIPAEVTAVIMRALDKDPQQRYSSAADFADACRAACPDDEAVIATIAQPPPAPVPTTRMYSTSSTSTAPPDSSRRGVVRLVSVMAVVVLALAAGAFVWFNADDGDHNGQDDAASGNRNLHEFKQQGEPIPYQGSDADDMGQVPEPVMTGGVAYFTHGGDAPEIVAVDLKTGTEKWRKPASQPIGKAMRAGKDLLYTADTDAGIVTIIDTSNGEPAKVIDMDTTIKVSAVNDEVLIYPQDSASVVAYNADGSKAWSRDFDSTIVDIDIEAKWKDYSPQPGRYSRQEPTHLVAYGQDGTAWRMDADSGEVLDSSDTGSDNSVTSAISGMMFTAAPAADGSGYTVTMRDISAGFKEVGKWESLRSGRTPVTMVWCGTSRICIRDRDYGSADGAIVLDFDKPGGSPLWKSSGDATVSDIYAAGSTTAVVRSTADAVSTQLYDAKFEPLGNATPGTFRPIDDKTFIDYPRTGGDEPSNPVDKHFFTGLDATDGSTRNLGMRKVYPQCVTDSAHMVCPTPVGITVWKYRGGG